jgi:uroporphyrin-III C-methyltransferase/precorrin-2 dehydrogenase/sirohydrochlorin ferrochelatase
MATVPDDAYPLLLDLGGRRVVVVGGGPAAANHASALADAGAHVVVLSPRPSEAVVELETAGSVTVLRREWCPGDLADAWLVHAATGERSVDNAVTAEAESRRIFCARSDDAAAATARVPEVTRTDGVVVAVAADAAGTHPRRTRAVRDAVTLALDTAAFPLRRRRTGPPGVSLVGGGPGDPELLTIRARRRLAQADVVVADRLGPRAVLDELDPDVLVVDVGKSPEHHPVPQEEINRLLVAHARAGRRVVRLKGGDPYVLGRGGEELAFCRAAGVEVEVVPGVTSAFAVPAAAGIPVTHRGLSRQVTVLSGHEDADWAALARSGGTLVFLMGAAALPAIVAGLLAEGMDPATPVAVVERGWLPDQRTTAAPLGRISEVATGRPPRAPAVVVVGAVASLADESDRVVRSPVRSTAPLAFVPRSPSPDPEALARASR